MPQDFDLEQFKSTYFEECQDLLASAEEHLNELRDTIDNVDVEILHAIFRAVHSIKGGGGAFNFTQLVEFAHVFETLLDSVREGRVKVTEGLADVLLHALDVLSSLVSAAQNNEEVPSSSWQGIANTLEAYNRGEAPGTSAGNLQSSAPETTQIVPEEGDGWGIFEPLDADEPTEQVVETNDDDLGWGLFDDEDPVLEAEQQDARPLYKIVFSPEPHLLRFANEPLLIVRELARLGELDVQVDLSNLPKLTDIVPDEAYFKWVYFLRTDHKIEDIHEVFEFVVDDCELKITKVDEKTEIDQPVIQPAPAAETKESVSVETPPVPDEPAVPLVLEKTPALNATPPVQAKEKTTESQASTSTQPTAPKVSSIRVELDRVDRLVNMVGELVITQAMLKQQVEDLPYDTGHLMTQGFEDLSVHTRELQESVMAIRMQPVKSVFARMPRLVRELSMKLNKKVDLITSGEMTEVDKTVIEQLADPLTHMIRNSVDHGIETAQERAQSGKSERASIHLSAEHRSGRIQIQVSDDGKGIGRDKVLEKAIEKGVVASDANLSPEEIDNLIFAPGFSTADKVTDVSGRGVGMDVVRRNIVNLGGRISVMSEPGAGTKFILSLPLTLAVLDGMIIQCGDEKYIIPLTAIMESIRPSKQEIKNLVGGGTVVSVRGEYIRVVHLNRLFNVKHAIDDVSQALVVIAETERYGQVGIVVDELLGQQQVVIKSLEDNYDPVSGISAATILGNGKVALILDVDGLAEMEIRQDNNQAELKLNNQSMNMGGSRYGIR